MNTPRHILRVVFGVGVFLAALLLVGLALGERAHEEGVLPLGVAGAALVSAGICYATFRRGWLSLSNTRLAQFAVEFFKAVLLVYLSLSFAIGGSFWVILVLSGLSPRDSAFLAPASGLWLSLWLFASPAAVRAWRRLVYGVST